MKLYTYGNTTDDTTVTCEVNDKVGNSDIISANITTVGDQVVGIHFDTGRRIIDFGVTDLPVGAKTTPYTFTDVLQPVGLLGTSDGTGKIYSLGFVK